MDNIDVIYYINLEHREDRNQEFLYEMDRISVPREKIARIDAVYNSQYPYIGCTESHVKAVKIFLESDHKLALICEDDFMIKDPENFKKTISSFFNDNIHFDVCLVSYSKISESEPSDYNYLQRIRFTQAAAGYIVRKEYAQRLYNNFKECFDLSVKEVKEKHIMKSNCYYVDVHWNLLMKQDTWYAFVPRLAIQRPSFSDIERAFMDYKMT